MKRVVFVLLLAAMFCLPAAAQTESAATPAKTKASEPAKPKKQIFRANKSQITEAQTKLKTANIYAGEVTGKTNPNWKTAVKSYQKDNGLKETGTLNRATLEKMGIELSDTQKAVAASPNTYPSDEPVKTDTSTKTTTRKAPFHASRDQINEAQRMLKAKSMYIGEETGKLDDATREGLKKFQEASGLRVTGTLNRVTLEKMGIALTDRQKAQ